MNDLQKDQAIFKAMKEIANEVFNKACAAEEVLRNSVVNEKGGVLSLKDILATRNVYYSQIHSGFVSAMKAENENDDDVLYKRVIDVDTFHCEFPATSVFELLNNWKSLAKIKGEITFTYEEKIELPLVANFTFTFDNAANAKKLTKCLSTDDLRPILGVVCVELNLDNESASFVASDGHILSVITTDKVSIHRNNPNDHILRALYTRKDWERICDYARKNKNEVSFEFYQKADKQGTDTAVAILGDTRLKSIMQDSLYPNWHSVIPFYTNYQHFTLKEESVRLLETFLKSKGNICNYYTFSVYEGCNYLYVEFTDYDYSKHSVAKFEMTENVTSDGHFSVRKEQVTKLLVSGFWLHDETHGLIFDDKQFDYTLLMPTLSDWEISEKEADERRGFVLHPKYDEVPVEENAEAVVA